MRVVHEDATASSYEAGCLEEVAKEEPVQGGMDTRASRPESPRSTLIERSDREYEDGVILTGNTRTEKMTRRRGMSNIFGTNNRVNNTDSQKSHTKSEKAAPMRPGLHRNISLRTVIQNQFKSSGREEGPNATSQVKVLKQKRRASMGAQSSLTSSPSILRPSPPSLSPSRGASRALLKSKSQRSLGASSHRLKKSGSQRSMGISSHSSSGRNDLRRNLQRQSSVAELLVDCGTTVSVSNSWASVRQVPDYQKRFGEQTILKIMERQPRNARSNMRLDSFFSDRFTHLCTVLVEVIDMIVTLLGPDLEEAGLELAQMGQKCRDEGIPTDCLGEAVSNAVAVLLGNEADPDVIAAWNTTFDALKRRLALQVDE